MHKILNKRVFRSLKKHWFRYSALFILIVMVMYIIVSMMSSAEAVIYSTKENSVKYITEDGHFDTFVPLDEITLEYLSDEGLTIEKQFFIDYKNDDGSTLRVYQVRQDINLISIAKGKNIANGNEIIVEKLYSDAHDLKEGAKIKLGSKEFTLTGTGFTTDIENPRKNDNDISSNKNIFGTAFVSSNNYSMLEALGEYENSQVYRYAYLLNGKMTNDELKNYISNLELDINKIKDKYFLEMLNEAKNNITAEMAEQKEIKNKALDEKLPYELNNLVSFVKADDNTNIGAARDDVKTTKGVAILAGIIVLALITYVISVFVMHSIDRETTVIGSLYALGVKRKQLVRHYLILPVIVTFLGGIVGTLIGFSSFAIDHQMEMTYQTFSIPRVQYVYPLYLIIYGTILPPVIAIIVNYIAIHKKLSMPVLKMIRNEQKDSRVSKFKIKSKNFIKVFRIRQTLREIKSCGAIIFGMTISLLVFMLGFDCYVCCKNVEIQSIADTRYNYMYLYKYTANTNDVPEGGEIAYTESLKKQYGEFNFNITLLGIDNENKYFNFDVESGENLVAISSSIAKKYGLNEGEKLVIKDDINNIEHSFKIDKIVDYSVGLYAFMDINSMRSLFEKNENYFNTVFSDKALDINGEQLYMTTTKEDVEKSSSIFVSLMEPLITTLMTSSIAVFVIVMYLMVKVMIDRSAQNIALMKVFGFRKSEVRKLYLDGNFIIIGISALICIPLSKIIIDKFFPIFIANCPMGLDLKAQWYFYPVIYATIILCYFLISLSLTRKINRVVPVEALKNRE